MVEGAVATEAEGVATVGTLASQWIWSGQAAVAHRAGRKQVLQLLWKTLTG